jgi:hypothetical protein
MVVFSEIGSVLLVLTTSFTVVTNEVATAFLVDSAFISEAESEKSTIFFLSQRYCFVS